MDPLNQLTITFSGIMTHFYDCIPFDCIAPKIPLRSVIPNALAVNMGFLQRDLKEGIEISPSLLGYYLMPHVALISDTEIVDANSSNWIPLLGTHLQVANPAKAPFTPPPLEDGYHLNEYVPELKISKDVVQNGDAAGYFDIYNGTVTVLGDKTNPTSSLSTQVVIETDGIPRLQITPFFPRSPLNLGMYSFLDENQQWQLPNGKLYVSNFDIASGAEDAPIEFLLNYLVAEGGLPQAIANNTPGMSNKLQPMTLELLGDRLQALGWIIKTSPLAAPSNASNFIATSAPGEAATSPPGSDRPLTPLMLESLVRAVLAHGPVPLDQSCSDSRFP